MRGLDRLRRVADLLSGDGDPWERLQAAGFEFLLAAVGREGWPSGLRAEAERVRAGLLTAGVADGDVWEADEAEVIWLADDLLRLCEHAERAAGGHTLSGHRHPGVRPVLCRVGGPVSGDRSCAGRFISHVPLDH